MADTMKMEYKIFLEAEDVSQSRILSCASYMKRVLESCNNPYISRAELDDESDLDDFVPVSYTHLFQRADADV